MKLARHLAVSLMSLSLVWATPAFAAHDASGVNLEDDPEVTTLTSARTGHAAFNLAELASAKALLAPDQRVEFETVYTTLSKYPGVQAQLEALLVKHRLKQKDQDQHTVLNNLNALATRPTIKGIAAADIVADLVSDICRPSTISQATHNTCTATSVQSALARSRPGEYARLVVGLATGTGTVSIGGLQLSAYDYLPFKDRSVSSNLLQPAIMQAEAAVEGANYKNKEDKVFPKTGTPHPGASQGDLCEVEAHLLGGTYAVMQAGPQREHVLEIREILRKATPRNPRLVGIILAGSGGHEIQVVGFDKDHYTVRNPWGEIHQVPAQKFEDSVANVSYRKD
jgi:hypothetical protein